MLSNGLFLDNLSVYSCHTPLASAGRVNNQHVADPKALGDFGGDFVPPGCRDLSWTKQLNGALLEGSLLM